MHFVLYYPYIMSIFHFLLEDANIMKVFYETDVFALSLRKKGVVKVTFILRFYSVA